jgi:hypothetical protein
MAQEPAREVEQAVARCWAAMFDVREPRLDHDFFLAGGDSLSATRLASALRRSTSREFSVEDVLVGRMVGGIAARLAAADRTVSRIPSGSAPVFSPAQRRLWFVEQFAPGTPVHNIVLSEQIAGVLDVAALEDAFEYVSTRQTALRWQMLPGTWVPEVIVADPSPVVIPIDDLSALTPETREAAVDRLLDEEAHTPIGLTDGPLWRVRLLRLRADEHVLVISVHHVIFDGWSQSILYRELGQAYQRRVAGESLDDGPPPSRTTFADYTARTRDLAARAGPADVAWWRQHLAGAPKVLDLPRDRPRGAVLSFGGARCAAAVDAEIAKDVARLAAAEGTTVSAVAIAAFSVLLRRLSGHTDLLVGVPVADRGHAEFEDIVGFFIRTLPLRLTVDDGDAFIDLVRRCGEELAIARQHADVPLERIVEVLGDDRDLSRNPLFQVMFNVYNFAEPHLDIGSPLVSQRQAGIPGSLVDLTVYVIPRDGGMRLEAAYNLDLCDDERIDALLGSYAHLLHELVREPRRAVSAASARPDNARLPDWTAPLSQDVPATPDLLSQIRAVARDRPDSVAIEGPDCTLTYSEVIRISDAVAAALRGEEVRAEDVVTVLARQTTILPPVVLGVLSMGARWVILDCGLPASAIDRRLSAVKPRALIKCDQSPEALPLSTGLLVIDAAALVVTDPAAEQVADVPAEKRGYLSLTSGTTGEPKAVHVGEAPLAHFLNWYRATFGLGPEDRFPLLGNVAHDPLLREVFASLFGFGMSPCNALHAPRS